MPSEARGRQVLLDSKDAATAPAAPAGQASAQAHGEAIAARADRLYAIRVAKRAVGGEV